MEISNQRPVLQVAIDMGGGRLVLGDQVGHLYLVDLEASTFRLIHRLSSCVTCLGFVNSVNKTGVNFVACVAHYQTIHFLSTFTSIIRY